LVIEHGDEPVGVDLIAVGERQFGLISGEQVIAARANERPVVFVYEWFQQYPVGVVAPAASGIASAEDLVGRRIGIPGRFGASYAGFLALLAANGLVEQDVQLEPIGFNAPDVVCLGAVEASVIYVNNEPLQIAQRAAAGECGAADGVTVIPVAAAADMVSNGVITNEATIAQDPELVRAVVDGFDRGLRDTINNPAQAYLISAVYVDNLPLTPELRTTLEAAADEQVAFLAENPDADRATIAARREALAEDLRAEFDAAELLQFEVLLASIELWDADQLGVTEPDSWALTQDTLLLMDFISAGIDLEAAYTNDFVPAAVPATE
ncbi:MAG: ABC transporter substrate-binding protein, partial [Chloroflexi bacterium]|nr:ABC transporter substrate-binding protein [Chloroflexota bacterium]